MSRSSSRPCRCRRAASARKPTACAQIIRRSRPQGRARTRARDGTCRRTSLQATLAKSTGEIESPVAKVEGARRAGRDAAGALRQRRQSTSRSMTTCRACWWRSTAGSSRSPSSATPKSTGTALLPLQSTADAGRQLADRDLRHAGVEPARQRPRGRLARALKERGCRERIQLVVLHLGRQPRAGARRHPRRSRRLRPHLAGDAGACLPIGVAAAIYLEEFAPKNRLTELIEVNINNLAAVPSIVFGLLGLAMFLNFSACRARRRWSAAWCWPCWCCRPSSSRRAPRSKAVPPSIKEAALGVGASHSRRSSTTCCRSPCPAS